MYLSLMSPRSPGLFQSKEVPSQTTTGPPVINPKRSSRSREIRTCSPDFSPYRYEKSQIPQFSQSSQIQNYLATATKRLRKLRKRPARAGYKTIILRYKQSRHPATDESSAHRPSDTAASTKSRVPRRHAHDGDCAKAIGRED